MTPTRPSRRTVAALFAAGLALSGASLLQGIQPNDEGLMLQAAARIAGGQVPYRDFWWFYPPGQAYLLAGLWELAGPSLLPWRVLRVLCDASVGVLAYLLAARAARPPVAVLAWSGAVLAMAYPSGPHPFAPTLVACLGALLLLERAPLAAGALAGVAAAWRLEFAAGLAAAAVLALALRGPAPRRRGVLRFAVAAALMAAALYAPVVLSAGLERSFELIVRYPLLDFGDFQSLPFPLTYDGPLNTGSLGGFLSDSAENLLLFHLPLVLVLGLAGGLLSLTGRWRALDATALALGGFALVMAQYLRVRPDVFHTAPLAVCVAVLGAWGLAAAGRGGASAGAGRRSASAGREGAHRRSPAALPGLVAAAALAYLVVEGADRRVRAVLDDTVAVASPAADGARADAGTARGLNAALRHVRARTRPGEPIYVAGRRADLVTAGHPLFYVLAGRPNPTRYDIQAPGVVTTAPVQRELVSDLERARPRLVVRWTDPVTAVREPNRAGRSSGVRLLDEHLARRYTPVARFGDFLVLERR